MLDPKSPLAAAGIFAAGILVRTNQNCMHKLENIATGTLECCVCQSKLVDLISFYLYLQVIGYSILDVNRSLRQNSEPVTEQQNQHINQQVQESERNVTGAFCT